MLTSFLGIKKGEFSDIRPLNRLWQQLLLKALRPPSCFFSFWGKPQIKIIVVPHEYTRWPAQPRDSAFDFPFAASSRENMASTLEQLKKYTTVVADSGDFESKKETVCWCLCCFVCIAHFPCVRSCFSYLAVQTYRCNHQPFLALGCLQNATVSAFAGESCAVWKIQWKVQGIVCFKQFLKKFDALSACQSSI